LSNNLFRFFFKDKFLDKLKEKDYSCTYYLIRDVDRDAPLYYLVFATTNERASQWYEDIKGYVDEILKKEWMKKIKYEIKPIIDLHKDQHKLNEFD